MRVGRTTEEVSNLIESGDKIVFVFTAEWCGDCRYLKPYLPEIEEEFKEVTFVQLDRDEFLPLAKEWDIFGIPSLVVFKDGEEIGRFVDKHRKTKEQIKTFLEGLVS